MSGKYATLGIDAIDFDTDNPRIKKALEKYGDRLNAERIHFALRSATEGTGGASSYFSLKDSIRANGRVTTPIVVVPKGERWTCIDGNTRLAIYKELGKEGAEGNWSEITAMVPDDTTQPAIEAIRVSAHLVGPREWPAYEKARYLHYLRSQKFMDYNQLIALCGGNRKNIERHIDAYHEMNEYYRDVVADDAFQIDRFSGFVELQKSDVKDAIFAAGLDLKDFGEWIHSGKIYHLADVRRLPVVLRDEEARKIFLEGGPRSIEKAVKVCDRKSEEGQSSAKTTLDNASLSQLAAALAHRIEQMPRSEWRALKDREHADAVEQIRTLEDLADQLRDLLGDVSE